MAPQEFRLGQGFDQKQGLENRERPLKGKVALITGSGRDIGGGIAIALAKEGAQIIGNYLNKPKKAEEIIKEIEKTDGFIDFVQADITIPEDRQRLKKTLESSGGKLDILVLNTSGNTETARQVCVEANNALVNELPINEGGKIILMQSVPGHFDPQLRGLNKMPAFYDPIANAKYEGEQLLRLRIPEFQKKKVLFVVVCPPEVSDTSNMRVFQRRDKSISEKHAEISDMFGLPRTVTTKDVGQKVAELLKRKDLPQGHVELFSSVLDARSILSEWYGDNAIFVDTLEMVDENRGVGRMIVAKEYTKGHFNERVGEEVMPGHLMAEAAAQTAGLVSLGSKVGVNSMPLLQGYTINLTKIARPGEGLKINAEVTEVTEITKRGFTGNVNITNMKDEKVAEVIGLKAMVVNKDLARRLLRG